MEGAVSVVEEDDDDASDLATGGVGSRVISGRFSSESMGDATTVAASAGEATSSFSGRGRCSARKVSLPTEDIPLDLKRRIRVSLFSVGGKS